MEAWDVQDDLLLREAVEAGASLAALAAGAVRRGRALLPRTCAHTLTTRARAGALLARVHGGGGDCSLARAAVRR
jgi:hypothetical protein